ncbi:MAG: hypothetical protein K6E91_01510 [Butyrivibrio sp.]|nr:hypothetical protein [Butyrivibrio sp.]
MTDIFEISEEELDDFQPLLGKDLSDDVKRVYYKALGAVDEEDNAIGALVYEVLDSESEEDTRSRICMFKSDDVQTLKELSKYYKDNSVAQDEIAQSFYELDDEKYAKALAEDGFSFGKKEDDTITFTLEDLENTPMAKSSKIPEYVGSIESLTPAQFRDAVKQILFKGHRGILEDIAFLPKTWFDNNISSCVISGDKIQGLFLIRRTPSGKLIPVLYFAYGPESRTHLTHMLRYTTRQALERYPYKTKVMIQRKNDDIRTLVGKLMPGRSGDEIFYGIRKE